MPQRSTPRRIAPSLMAAALASQVRAPLRSAVRLSLWPASTGPVSVRSIPETLSASPGASSPSRSAMRLSRSEASRHCRKTASTEVPRSTMARLPKSGSTPKLWTQIALVMTSRSATEFIGSTWKLKLPWVVCNDAMRSRVELRSSPDPPGLSPHYDAWISLNKLNAGSLEGALDKPQGVCVRLMFTSLDVAYGAPVYSRPLSELGLSPTQ